MISQQIAIKQLKLLKDYSSKIRLAAEGWDSNWKILLSTMLSARTRDETTIPVSENLFNIYKNPHELAKAKLEDLQKILKPVNFFRNKSKHVLNCAKILSEKYNCEPPLDFEKLIELPGVGRKTANVFLSELGNDTIGVDTHLSYLSAKLEWTKSKSQKNIEEDLKKLFPKKYWKELNPILVRFGKTYTSRKKKNELLGKIKDLS